MIPRKRKLLAETMEVNDWVTASRGLPPPPVAAGVGLPAACVVGLAATFGADAGEALTGGDALAAGEAAGEGWLIPEAGLAAFGEATAWAVGP